MIGLTRIKVRRFAARLNLLAWQPNMLGRSSLSLILQIAFATFSFLQTVMLARLLDVGAYGSFSLAMAFISLLALPASFGLPNLIMRETAKARSHTRPEFVKGVWRWSTFVALILSLGLALITLLAIRFSDTLGSSNLKGPLLWGSALIPLIALVNLKAAALRGLDRVIQGQVPDRLLRPLLFTFFLTGFALLSQSTLTPTKAMFIGVCATGLSLIIAAILLSRSTPQEVVSARASYKHRAWLSSAIPLALTSGMLVLNRYTDVVMLGIFTSHQDVGIYRVAAQVSLLVAFGLNAVNMVVAPQFTKLFEQQKMQELQRIVSIGTRITLLFTLPAAILFLLLGKHFLVLCFGVSFAPAFLPTAILIGGQVLNSAAGPVGILLNMTGHEKAMTRGVTVAALGNIVLNFTLIPLWGINGAALATSITLVVWNVMLWNDVRHRLGINSLAFTLKK